MAQVRSGNEHRELYHKGVHDAGARVNLSVLFDCEFPMWHRLKREVEQS